MVIDHLREHWIGEAYDALHVRRQVPHARPFQERSVLFVRVANQEAMHATQLRAVLPVPAVKVTAHVSNGLDTEARARKGWSANHTIEFRRRVAVDLRAGQSSLAI